MQQCCALACALVTCFATCFAQQRRHHFCSNVAIVWSDLGNAGPTILEYVVLKCCDRLAGPTYSFVKYLCSVDSMEALHVSQFLIIFITRAILYPDVKCNSYQKFINYFYLSSLLKRTLQQLGNGNLFMIYLFC